MEYQVFEKDTESVNNNDSIVEKSDDETKVNLTGAISLIVGTMIGSGIFSSVGDVFINSGSPGMALLSWFSAGVLVMLISLCYIELGTMIPKSGSEFPYILEAFGQLPAFIFTFTTIILLRPAGILAVLLSTGYYITEPFFGIDCPSAEKESISKIIAAVALGNSISVQLWPSG